MKKSRSSIPRFDASEPLTPIGLAAAEGREPADEDGVAIAVGNTNDGSELPAKLVSSCIPHLGVSRAVVTGQQQTHSTITLERDMARVNIGTGLCGVPLFREMAANPLPPASYTSREKAAPVRMHAATRADIALTNLTRHNIGQLKKLNELLFPVNYSEKVYESVLTPELRPLCKLALYNDVPVGMVCCRVEPDGADTHIYIMMLGVLPAYRRLGIARRILEHIIETAAPGKPFDGREITSLYLHVQTGNDAARQLYERFGFSLSGEVPNYYRDIQPTSAWVLQKRA